jgi:3-oxoacyl-[acyl-carrier-protein] synthase-3
MRAHIAAVEYVLPDYCLTNEELDRLHPEWSIHKVAERAGVITRFICAETETALDLATAACQQLLERSGLIGKDVGAIIFCTQSPDHVMPPNATLLQHRLGLPTSIAAFDYSLACSGFIYGLFMAKALIESELLDNILLVTAESYSKHINPADRATMALFGDGAAVTLLHRGKKGIGEFVVGTDGSGGDRFIIPAGGARILDSQATFGEMKKSRGDVRTDHNIHMDGPAVLAFAKERVPPCVRDLLVKTGYLIDDISLFVFHQASGLSLDYLEKALAIPASKMYRNLSKVGNTVSASIPIALRDAELEGRIVPGSRLMLVGFGVGFSWGACIVDW